MVLLFHFLFYSSCRIVVLVGWSFDFGSVHACAGSGEVETLPKNVFVAVGFHRDIDTHIRQRSSLLRLDTFHIVSLRWQRGPFFSLCAFVAFEIPSTLVFLAFVHRRPRLDLRHVEEERRAEVVRGFPCRCLPRLGTKRRNQDQSIVELRGTADFRVRFQDIGDLVVPSKMSLSHSFPLFRRSPLLLDGRNPTRWHAPWPTVQRGPSVHVLFLVFLDEPASRQALGILETVREPSFRPKDRRVCRLVHDHAHLWTVGTCRNSRETDELEFGKEEFGKTSSSETATWVPMRRRSLGR